MNRTLAIGGILCFAGFVTHGRFTQPSYFNQERATMGGIALLIGGFLVWNGYVANYNNDLSFAIFG